MIIPDADIYQAKQNEENTKKIYITPVLDERWKSVEGADFIMEYTISAGRVALESGEPQRTEAGRADYLLLAKRNFPIAVLEAKAIDRDAKEGYSQAIEYAAKLQAPFAYASNGDDLIEEDLLTGLNRTIKMKNFPTPDELWARYLQESGITADGMDLLAYPDYVDPMKPDKKPRYYQRIAINRVLKAILDGKKKMLLCMATGTGKTYTAFQIVWKLYKMGYFKKILYLVDRDALGSQLFQKDFKPFHDMKKMVLMDNSKLKEQTAYEVYVALYQQLITKKHDYFTQIPADFFDLIIVDECHRGSADVAGNWHRMLDYFSSAVQIGLTATPKETEDVSNIAYFCKETGDEPIYTYSLTQGINDGYLAPYRVVGVKLNVDERGYFPEEGKLDIKGEPVERRTYTQQEFDRAIIVEDRRETVAQRIYDYMVENDCRFAKTIVFCESQEHAADMVLMLKALNSDLVKEYPKYIVRIVSDDKEGKKQIDNFTDPSSQFPVIAVTSKLLGTGIDTETTEIIVLDKTIGSMTEFKQTIGRGTRIKENYKIKDEVHNKLFFTILDFRKNYPKFKDPDFDGEPVSIMDVEEKEKFPKWERKEKEKGGDGEEKKKEKRKIARVRDVFVAIEGDEVSYVTENGVLVQENLTTCVRNNIKDQYPGFELFYGKWLLEPRKNDLANLLLIDASFVSKARTEIGFNADKYDIICSYGYDKTPRTREERLEHLMSTHSFQDLPHDVRTFLRLVLYQYKLSDYYQLLNVNSVFSVPEIKNAGYSAIPTIKTLFKTKGNYIDTISRLENELYTV